MRVYLDTVIRDPAVPEDPEGAFASLLKPQWAWLDTPSVVEGGEPPAGRNAEEGVAGPGGSSESW